MVVAYHGTKDLIDRFVIDGDVLGNNTANNGGAIFFTSSKDLAMEYSKEAFIRFNEWNNDYNEEDVREQAHAYKVNLRITNPLYIDVKRMLNKYYTRYGNMVDANRLNHLVNILQGRRYQAYMECYDEIVDMDVFEDYLDLFEEYNEELDDYEVKECSYDCIIIKNCIDSINEDSNYMEQDLYVVLDENIVDIIENVKECNN